MSEVGRLTTYLGTAPGVGKTHDLLIEAQRRATSGARVVIGWLETHGRPGTQAQIAGLETIAPITIDYRGGSFAEPDIQAILSAKADVVVVDELAHTWPDRRRTRWMDLKDLLSAGADALTSLNIANLLSVRDYAARITGTGRVESVPDEFVRSGEVVLIDMPADALRNRLQGGGVFSADQVGGALGEYFRVSNLEALSLLGRAWMEDALEAMGDSLLADRDLVPLTRRAVVMAGVNDSRWGESVIHRAASIACASDADLVVVHARTHDGSGVSHPEVLDHYRQLTEELGGRFVEADGDNVPRVLADQATAREASVLVLSRHHSPFIEVLRGSVPRRLSRLVPDLSVVEVRKGPLNSSGEPLNQGD
jgi:two-component system sensor histidine kinase KdpD